MVAAMARDSLELANAREVQVAMSLSDARWRPSRRFDRLGPQLFLLPTRTGSGTAEGSTGQPIKVTTISTAQIHEVASPEMQAPIETAAKLPDGEPYSGTGCGPGK